MRRLTPLLALLALPAPAGAIVNGSAATTEGQFPWQVAVWSQLGGCGGVLVAPERILTAAHCTAGLMARQVMVRVNSIDWSSGGEVHEVAEIAHHPSADVSGEIPRHDLSILELAAPVTDPHPIDPIDPEGSVDDALWQPLAELVVSGWGSMGASQQHALPERLHYVDVERWEDDGGPPSCTDGAPGIDLDWGPAFDPVDMLCAIRIDGGVVHESCGGDSGGPLVASISGTPLADDPPPDVSDAAEWRLVGLVSWGSPSCEDPARAGVYTRLGSPDLNAFAQPGHVPTFQPRNSVAPTLAGAPVVGETLTCSRGSWANEPDSTSISFYRSGVLVSAGPSSYVLTESDIGRHIRCLVTASNGGGTVSAQSNLVGPIQAAPAPVAGPVPPPPPSAPPPAPLLPPPQPPAVQPPPPGTDDEPPNSRARGKDCRTRRCTIAILAEDEGSAGIRSLRVRLYRRVSVRCRRDGRPARCTRGRRVRIRVVRVSAERFHVRTGRLRPGRYRLTVVAFDRAGNRERRALRAGFRMR